MYRCHTFLIILCRMISIWTLRCAAKSSLFQWVRALFFTGILLYHSCDLFITLLSHTVFSHHIGMKYFADSILEISITFQTSTCKRVYKSQRTSWVISKDFHRTLDIGFLGGKPEQMNHQDFVQKMQFFRLFTSAAHLHSCHIRVANYWDA